MLQELPSIQQDKDFGLDPGSCAHRSVSKDGRIVCGKVVEGENEVSPNVCWACPAKAVNCTHLRFSLRQSVPSPLIVRYNGRTEVWDDDPPELCFERAACDAQVMPIHSPRACAGCSLRQPQWAVREPPVRRGRASNGSNRGVKGGGRVVPFPGREAVAATG
jgi:hypothetical protein